MSECLLFENYADVIVLPRVKLELPRLGAWSLFPSFSAFLKVDSGAQTPKGRRSFFIRGRKTRLPFELEILDYGKNGLQGEVIREHHKVKSQ